MFENYKIKLYDSSSAKPLIVPFVASFHYLGESMPRGCDKWFCLVINNRLRGVAAFGIPAGKNCRQKYGQDTLELRRFVLHPDLPKNSGSWFMAQCLRQLKQWNILTYSDPAVGHTGHLYKVSNFDYLGKQRQGSTRVEVDGKINFAQALRSKSLKKKKLVYMPKKDIWFYKRRD